MTTSTSHPLSKHTIESALKDLAADRAIVSRFAWVARHRFASEHWFQFELAHRLEHALHDAYCVGCERHKVDIVFYSLPQATIPLYESDFVAGIELKWCANWWTKDQAELTKDVQKVEMYDFAALALGVWLVVWPREDARYLTSIREAVDKGTGAKTAAEVRATLTPVPAPHFEFDIACRDHDDFESVGLWARGYWNTIARRELEGS
jgi:hypothetical protein